MEGAITYCKSFLKYQLDFFASVTILSLKSDFKIYLFIYYILLYSFWIIHLISVKELVGFNIYSDWKKDSIRHLMIFEIRGGGGSY